MLITHQRVGRSAPLLHSELEETRLGLRRVADLPNAESHGFERKTRVLPLPKGPVAAPSGPKRGPGTGST